MKKIIAVSALCLASFIALPVAAGEKHAASATGKSHGTSMEAPITAGYENVKAIFRPSGSAPAVYGPGDIYNFLLTGKESNNVFFQFEALVSEGGGPPPHIHSREDETFYVISGSLEILLGDKIHQAKAGDFVYIPRGTVHRFKNVGKDMSVQLVTFSPAGVDKFMQEVFPEVKDRKAVPPPITEELIRKMGEAAPKYGMKFLPPSESGKK